MGDGEEKRRELKTGNGIRKFGVTICKDRETPWVQSVGTDVEETSEV
jgi:hypothetical protein